MGISFSLLPNRAAGNFSSPSLNNLRMPGQERSCMRSESRKNGLLQPWHSIDFGMRKNVREFGLTELMIEFHNRLASSPSTRALHCVKSKIFKFSELGTEAVSVVARTAGGSHYEQRAAYYIITLS